MKLSDKRANFVFAYEPELYLTPNVLKFRVVSKHISSYELLYIYL